MLEAMSEGVILVVDDDEGLRESLCEILNEEGYRTVAAADGAQALAWLRSSEAAPRLILLDLMMPVMNGWQFRERQRDDPRLSKIPVVVLTAAGATRGTVDADAMMAKPVRLDDLLALVGQYLA